MCHTCASPREHSCGPLSGEQVDEFSVRPGFCLFFNAPLIFLSSCTHPPIRLPQSVSPFHAQARSHHVNITHLLVPSSVADHLLLATPKMSRAGFLWRERGEQAQGELSPTVCSAVAWLLVLCPCVFLQCKPQTSNHGCQGCAQRSHCVSPALRGSVCGDQ